MARAAPFAVFLLLTFCQGKLGESSQYWFYLAKTLVGAWLIWEMRPFVAEMKLALSWEAVVIGICVCAMWIGIDNLYPHLDVLMSKIGFGTTGAKAPVVLWNPNSRYGEGTPMAWFFVLARLAGSSLVVPPLEEVFYRSFLYRYIAKPDFQSVQQGRFIWLPFLATSLVFGFEHQQWLPGILCGFAFQWLVIRKQRIGDAITAHGITNLLLGLYVVSRGAWQFW